MRSIISRIGTAKYFSKPISPLSISLYTVSNTKDFAQNIRPVKVPTKYLMISFNVQSLFTNGPSEYTTDLVFEIIYYNRELSTDITRSKTKEMLTLCMKNVHFTFNGDIYLQRVELL